MKLKKRVIKKRLFRGCKSCLILVNSWKDSDKQLTSKQINKEAHKQKKEVLQGLGEWKR